MNPSVSLIINTYNRLPALRLALQSLRLLRYPELEVIVVDGPSDDGTAAYLAEHWAGHIKIAHCPAANLSQSRNIGLALAAGDIVAYTDDDGLPEPDWLDQLLPVFQDPRVAAAGGFVRNHTGVAYQCRYVVSDRAGHSEEQVDDLAALPPCTPGAFRFPRPVGVNAAFRRTALLAIGGFDEEYAYFYDEVDTTLRLIDAGYQVRLIPTAEVHHKYAPSHLRTHQGVARSWLPFLRSTAYYLLRAAPPEEGLGPALQRIEARKEKFRADTQWMARTADLSPEQVQRFYEEIDVGAREGIRDAFRYPARRLLRQPPPPVALRPFDARIPSTDRLRIALVSPHYPPVACGGVGVFMHQLAGQLGALGHEVTVITRGSGHPTVDFEDGVWVHRILDANPPPDLSPPPTMPAMPAGQRTAALCVLGELDRVQPRRRFHWVLGSIWEVDMAAVIASGRYRTALYLVTTYQHLVENKPDWARDAHLMEHFIRPMIAAERWAMEQAKRVVASTQAIATDVEQRYAIQFAPARLRLIPFGVPAAGGEASVPPRAGPPRLLYVGRFERRKGIDLLLQVIPTLAGRYPDWEFRLIGDRDIPHPDGGASDWDRFAKAHAGQPWLRRVICAGAVDPETLLDEYRRCDLFVAPSRYESFGLIYLEAMRYAKPCVGCRAGGIPEVIQDGETGLLAAPGDPASLQDALERLMGDADLRQHFGQAGLARYQAYFTLEAFATRILDAFGPNAAS